MVDQPSPFAGYTPFSEDLQGLGAAQKPVPIGGKPSGGVVPPPAAAATSPFGGYSFGQNTDSGDMPDAAPRTRAEGLTVASDYSQLPWSDAAVMAAKNLPTSVVHNIKDLYETGKFAALNPEEFGSAIQKGAGDFYRGFVAKGKGRSEEEMDPDARAALQAAQKSATEISTEPGLKKFVVERPADVMALASPMLTGTGSALTKIPVPGMTAAGKMVTTAGELADPILGPVKAAKMASGAYGTGTSLLESLKSGASYSSLKNAYESGATANPTFASHLIGNGTASDVSDRVVGAIQKMIDRGHAEYKAGRSGLSTATDLPFDKVDETLKNQYSRVMNKHGVINDPDGFAALQNLEQKVAEYKAQPPGANGIDDFDRLKRYIDGLKRTYTGNKSIADMLGDVRKSVFNTMYAEDPKYGKLMSKYADMMDDTGDIKNAFVSGSMNNPNSIATIKKIINTRDKGYTQSSWDKIVQMDPDIPHMIAAQELRNALPVGTARFLAQLIAAGLNPVQALGNLITSSPKVTGALQYGSGLVVGGAPNLAGKVLGSVPQPARIGAQFGSEAMTQDGAPRQGRASGGSVVSSNKADQLIRAAESAKKAINSRTEVLLDQPDEKIAGALAIAKRHI